MCLLTFLLAAALQSGQPIPLGDGAQRGPLGAGLTSVPVGTAHIHGSKQPDLFVMAGRNSPIVGLFLYRWTATAADGRPVFGARTLVKLPTKSPAPPGSIWEEKGVAHGLFVDGKELIHATYAAGEFREAGRVDLGALPRPPVAVTAQRRADGGYTLYFHVPDGTREAPAGVGSRDPQYVPYDGAGIWRGGLPYLNLYEVTRAGLDSGPLGEAKLVAVHDVLLSNQTLSVATYGLVSGSRFGDIYVHTDGKRRRAVGADGVLLRHPTVGASPVAYPNPVSGESDLIAGGEGALYYYRLLEGAKLRFAAPVAVLEENARIFTGTLSVPTQVDWDRDGAVDLVVGNSEGRVLWFRNTGTTEEPRFADGVALEAGGYPIHVEPGYKGDIQGPGEARWGYISPNVVDWNGDERPDILSGDSLNRQMVYLNHGGRLQPAVPLYLDGLDLHGTWRVRPGVARLNGRMAVVANDDQDEFHLYWRLDDYNLEDGGKLRMEDGSAIRANFLGAGGTGRSKLELVDWDGDGVVDLLVGTPRHHSVPEPEHGLPRALGLPGATVLFLKNTGTNAQPRFRFPEVLQHNGEPIYLGQHEVGASAGPLGGGKGPNLVVSREDGRLFFYRREAVKP